MNIDSVLVSVIIPVYNREEYLLSSVLSVMNQTHKNLQIIIIDDGSTDASPQMCDELANKDNRITVIHLENSGLCAARNKGLSLAKGEYISFLDSDDYFDLKFIEILLNATISNDTYLCKCKSVNITNKGAYIENQDVFECEAADLEAFFLTTANIKGYDTLSLCSTLYHSSLFSELKFDESSKDALDLVTFCELTYKASIKKLVTVNQILYYRLYHNKNMSTCFQTISKHEHEYGFRIAMEFWKDKHVPDIYDHYRQAYLGFCIHRFVPVNLRLFPERNQYTQNVTELVREQIISNGLLYHFSLPIVSGSLWNEIRQGQNYILYGFGKNGRNFVYPQLKHFKIPLIEIWDRTAEGSECIDNIPFCKAHSFTGSGWSDIPILITIEDKHIAAIVKYELRKLGYNKFYVYEQINNAIKYAIYDECLPFLLGK